MKTKLDLLAELKANRAAVVAGNTAFALDLYRQLRSEPGNLFFSPYSLSTALAMTYAGAGGETAQQMAKALHFTLPGEQLHPAFADLQADLNAAQQSNAIQLLVANSLWPTKDLPLRPGYVQQVERGYAAHVAPLDYTQPEAARQAINRWANKQTQGKIKELIPRGKLSSDAALVLANAICFAGQWALPFDPSNTQPDTFHLNPAAQVKAPMMRQTIEQCRYHADPTVQVLELPYASGQLSMVVLLPRQVDGLAKLGNELTVPKLAEWIGQLEDEKTDVWLPKFNITSGFALDEKLKALGMVDAFGGAADFSGMFEGGGPFLAAAVHKALVKVHELGTEADAGSYMHAMMCIPVEFHADHPFLFLIRDRSTGSILFLGRVTNPNQLESA